MVLVANLTVCKKLPGDYFKMKGEYFIHVCLNKLGNCGSYFCPEGNIITFLCINS
jgi:hypothetical protein